MHTCTKRVVVVHRLTSDMAIYKIKVKTSNDFEHQKFRHLQPSTTYNMHEEYRSRYGMFKQTYGFRYMEISLLCE